jgi:hypothetical protein
MRILKEHIVEEIVHADLLLATKILFFVHAIEYIVSESTYKFWYKITGSKFERREAQRPNACMLVTKRSIHLFPISLLYLFLVLSNFLRALRFFWEIVFA